MNLSELKENLVNQPMYVMFLDLNHGNIKTTYHYIKRNQEELDSFVERNGI